MKRFLNKWTRKWHRWGAVTCAVPMLLVIATGLLLQVKKHFEWVQPPTRQGSGSIPRLSFDEILAAARNVSEAGIRGWSDIDRLDVRPRKGIVKVRGVNRWEIQIDAHTGEVLQVAYRRSDLIESLHDGSWFHSTAKLWVFLPNGCILLVLWITGVYLWFLPVLTKRKNRARRAQRASELPSRED